MFKILEKYNLRERWKQVSEILERWKQVFRNLREIFPKSSVQNLREIVISERWKQIPEILERWKQVPEIACNITHFSYQSNNLTKDLGVKMCGKNVLSHKYWLFVSKYNSDM